MVNLKVYKEVEGLGLVCRRQWPWDCCTTSTTFMFNILQIKYTDGDLCYQSTGTLPGDQEPSEVLTEFDLFTVYLFTVCVVGVCLCGGWGLRWTVCVVGLQWAAAVFAGPDPGSESPHIYYSCVLSIRGIWILGHLSLSLISERSVRAQWSGSNRTVSGFKSRLWWTRLILVLHRFRSEVKVWYSAERINDSEYFSKAVCWTWVGHVLVWL